MTTKRYFAIVEEYLPNAAPEEKDEAQEKIRAFMLALIRLHAAVHSRDKKGKSASVNDI